MMLRLHPALEVDPGEEIRSAITEDGWTKIKNEKA